MIMPWSEQRLKVSAIPVQRILHSSLLWANLFPFNEKSAPRSENSTEKVRVPDACLLLEKKKERKKNKQKQNTTSVQGWTEDIRKGLWLTQEAQITSPHITGRGEPRSSTCWSKLEKGEHRLDLDCCLRSAA